MKPFAPVVHGSILLIVLLSSYAIYEGTKSYGLVGVYLFLLLAALAWFDSYRDEKRAALVDRAMKLNPVFQQQYSRMVNGARALSFSKDKENTVACASKAIRESEHDTLLLEQVNRELADLRREYKLRDSARTYGGVLSTQQGAQTPDPTAEWGEYLNRWKSILGKLPDYEAPQEPL